MPSLTYHLTTTPLSYLLTWSISLHMVPLVQVTKISIKTWLKIFTGVGLVVVLASIGMYAAPPPPPVVNLIPADHLNVVITVTGQGKVTSELWVEYNSFPELGSPRMAAGIKLGKFGRKGRGNALYYPTTASMEMLLTGSSVDPLTFGALSTKVAADPTQQNVYLDGTTWVLAPPDKSYFTSDRKTFRLRIDGTEDLHDVYSVQDFFYRVEGLQKLKPKKITVTLVLPYEAASFHPSPSGITPATSIQFFSATNAAISDVPTAQSHLAFGTCATCNYRPGFINRAYSSFTITPPQDTPLEAFEIISRFDLKAE